jgi:hypothetical protein
MSLKELVKNADNRLQSIENTVIKVEKTSLESVQSENIRLRSELNALKAKLDECEQVMSSAETLIRKQDNLIKKFTNESANESANESFSDTGDWQTVVDTIKFNTKVITHDGKKYNQHVITLAQFDSNHSLFTFNPVSGDSLLINGVPNKYQRHIISLLLIDSGYFSQITEQSKITTSRTLRYLSNEQTVFSTRKDGNRFIVTVCCGLQHKKLANKDELCSCKPPTQQASDKQASDKQASDKISDGLMSMITGNDDSKPSANFLSGLQSNKPSDDKPSDDKPNRASYRDTVYQSLVDDTWQYSDDGKNVTVPSEKQHKLAVRSIDLMTH